MGLLAWALFPPLLLLSPQVHGDCSSPPSQLHATLRTGELKDSYPVGTILWYNCLPGYQFIQGSVPSIRCLDSSEWSTTPTFCEGKHCKAPEIENGRIEPIGDLVFGTEITFFCDEGYTPLGKKTARCTLYEGNKVEWDNDPPFCEKISCERPPNIVDGRHSGDVYLDHYTVGNVVTYTCDRDLSLIGNSSITCITAEDGISGKWDKPAPECKAVECSRPHIPNGRLTSPFQSTYKYGHVLQFECQAGHKMMGSKSVKCEADSKWHPELPECLMEQPEKPTIRPAPDTTEETITKETGLTQTPGGTVPKDDSGNNKLVGIVIGVLVGVLVLAAAFFAFMKWRPCLKNGKSNSHPSSSDTYRQVPSKDILLEEKRKLSGP